MKSKKFIVESSLCFDSKYSLAYLVNEGGKWGRATNSKRSKIEKTVLVETLKNAVEGVKERFRKTD